MSCIWISIGIFYVLIEQGVKRVAVLRLLPPFTRYPIAFGEELEDALLVVNERLVDDVDGCLLMSLQFLPL
jgi:hypothetical protein